MNDIIERINKDFYEKHKEMFLLVEMLEEASFPFFFNLYDDLRPTPFGQLSLDDIDWEHYGLAVEVGKPVAVGLAEISIIMSTGESKDLLELLDMRPALENPNITEITPDDGKLTKDMTAKQCFEVIKKYYEY